MAKRKIQVTLDEARYDELARIAEREGKKLAAVVRESIERYCLGPEADKMKRDALHELFDLAAPVPDEYADWKSEYSARKSKSSPSQGEKPRVDETDE